MKTKIILCLIAGLLAINTYAQPWNAFPAGNILTGVEWFGSAGGPWPLDLRTVPVQPINFWTSGNPGFLRMVIEAGGKVGVNTIAPVSLNSQFEVNNDINLTSNPYNQGYRIGDLVMMQSPGIFNDNIYVGLGAGAGVPTFSTNTFRNTFVGYNAGYLSNWLSVSSTGSVNTFIGTEAGAGNIGGAANTYVGNQAGIVCDAIGNTFVGSDVALVCTTGTYNAFLGEKAGSTIFSGSRNTFIGAQSGSIPATISYAASLGFGALVPQSNQIILGRNFGATTDEPIYVGIGLSADNVLLGPRNYLEINASTTTFNPPTAVIPVQGASGLQFRQLNHFCIPQPNLGPGVLSLAFDGTVIYVPKGGIFGLCSDPSGLPLLAGDAGLDFNDMSIYFQDPVNVANQQNDIGIGFNCTDALLAKLDVQSISTAVPGHDFTHKFAGRFYETGTYGIDYGTDDFTAVWGNCDVQHSFDFRTNFGGDFYASNSYGNVGARCSANNTAYANYGVYASSQRSQRGTGVYADVNATSSSIGVDANATGAAAFNYGVFGQAIPVAGALNVGVYGSARTWGMPPPGSVNIAVYGDLLANLLCTPPGCPVYLPSAPDLAGYFDGDILVTTNTYWASDANLKQNIQELSNPMAIINQLHPKSYTFNQQQNSSMILAQGTHFGMLAQDVYNVLPQLTKNCIHPARFDSLGNQTFAPINFKAINYIEFIPFLIGGMKQLDSTNQAQQTQINSQQILLDSLLEIVANPEPPPLQQNPGDDGGNNNNGNENPQRQSVVLTGMEEPYLGQNIPNPFSEETHIDYYIPETRFCGSGSCQIIFYDQLGRVIQQAPIEKSGYGTINVSTKNLSNGVLTYKLLVNGEIIDVKKMVFNK